MCCMEEWESVERVRQTCWGVCRVRSNSEVRPERDRLMSPELHQWILCEVGAKTENKVNSECLVTAPM